MVPDPELLKRSQYFTPPNTEHPHSGRTHYSDWQEYHRPLARMHHAHLHDWGIASGLAVSVIADGGSIEVQPGVAIDSNGEMIALSSIGQADISLNQPGEAERQISAPFRLSTAQLAGQTCYLTIQFAERLRFGEGSGGKLEQTPWLRLQPRAGFVEVGISLILAVLEIGANGLLISLSERFENKVVRRVIGQSIQTLELRQSATTNRQVGEVTAATLVASDEGGLRVTVPNAAPLTVQADTTEFQGSLGVLGNLGIGTPNPRHRLSIVDGPRWTTDGWGGALELTNGTALGWQTNSANQRFGLGHRNGGFYVFRTASDPGTETSPAVYDLIIDDNGNVGVGTTTPRAKLDLDGDLQLLHGVAINEFSRDETLADNSHTAVPTERAVKEYIDNLLIGSVTAFATDMPPDGWLECNGFALPREGLYAKLFARIATRFGHGDGATTFNVPDLRGQFIRGWDHGSGFDPDRDARYQRFSGSAAGDAVGSYQEDAYRIHNHWFGGDRAGTESNLGYHYHSGDDRISWQSSQPSSGAYIRVMTGYSWSASSSANFSWTSTWHWITPLSDAYVDNAYLGHNHIYTPSGTIYYSGGSETRPTNASLMFCIKY